MNPERSNSSSNLVFYAQFLSFFRVSAVISGQIPRGFVRERKRKVTACRAAQDGKCKATLPSIKLTEQTKTIQQ